VRLCKALETCVLTVQPFTNFVCRDGDVVARMQGKGGRLAQVCVCLSVFACVCVWATYAWVRALMCTVPISDATRWIG